MDGESSGLEQNTIAANLFFIIISEYIHSIGDEKKEKITQSKSECHFCRFICSKEKFVVVSLSLAFVDDDECLSLSSMLSVLCDG